MNSRLEAKGRGGNRQEIEKYEVRSPALWQGDMRGPPRCLNTGEGCNVSEQNVARGSLRPPLTRKESTT